MNEGLPLPSGGPSSVGESNMFKSMRLNRIAKELIGRSLVTAVIMACLSVALGSEFILGTLPTIIALTVYAIYYEDKIAVVQDALLSAKTVVDGLRIESSCRAFDLQRTLDIMESNNQDVASAVQTADDNACLRDSIEAALNELSIVAQHSQSGDGNHYLANARRILSSAIKVNS
jgi:hypothetical protein